MKGIATAIATLLVVLASFANITQASQKDEVLYTGGKLSWSQFYDTGWYNSSLNNDSPTDENQLGMGAFVGYMINSCVGFEMGYDWLGRMPYHMPYKSINNRGEFKAHGIQLTAKLGYPVAKDLAVYTRLGGMGWHANSSNGVVVDDNGHDTGLSLVLAGGIECVMTHNMTTRLEYQWINDVGDNNTVGMRPDNGMLSLGVSYRFGQQKANLLVAPEDDALAAAQRQKQNKHLMLKSNVLFSFNNTSLKPEGQQTLDQLYNQLSDLDLKDNSIVVLGFTDRIGLDAYNQILSEKRAQSVVKYLVSKGILSSKISAHGMGKSNKITSHTCDNIKNRVKLIDCLAPDRRVEVEMKGLKKVKTRSLT